MTEAAVDEVGIGEIDVMHIGVYELDLRKQRARFGQRTIAAVDADDSSAASNDPRECRERARRRRTRDRTQSLLHLSEGF